MDRPRCLRQQPTSHNHPVLFALESYDASLLPGTMKSRDVDFEDQTSHPQRLDDSKGESVIQTRDLRDCEPCPRSKVTMPLCRIKNGQDPSQTHSQRSGELGSEWIRYVRVLHGCKPQIGN